MLTFDKLVNRFHLPIFQNIVSLSTIQFLNYIIPFVTIPYVVRILGPEKFGLINFAAAFVGYFSLLTDYGFNLSATREISIHRDNEKQLNLIVNSVLTVKFLLAVLSMIIFLVILLLVKNFQNELPVYLISFSYVVGGLLTPLWFFQGLEKMKLIIIPTVFVRVITTVLVFMMLKSQQDYLLYIWINGIGTIVIGIIALLQMKFVFKISFRIPPESEIKNQFKEGGLLFISTFSISLYTLSNTFILGLFAPLNVVGYYAGADKIRSAFQNILSPFTQAVYPHLSHLFSESKKKGFDFIKKVIRYFGIISLSGSLILFFFAQKIVLLTLGESYTQSILILKIISFLPFVIVLSNIFGVQILLNLGYKKAFTQIILFASMVNLILSFILVPIYFEIGTSIAVLFTEIIVTLLLFLRLIKENGHLFTNFFDDSF